MSSLDSKFSREDLETLIEAMGDWESLGNHEFHVLQMVKNIPMPPEDHEAFEFIGKLKEHFRNRERDIKDSRVTRQEKSVFLKAKLMLVRKDLGISQLFDMAAEAAACESHAAPKEKVPVMVGVDAPELDTSDMSPAEKGLAEAEFFIKDLGVWDHYQTFLADRKNSQ